MIARRNGCTCMGAAKGSGRSRDKDERLVMGNGLDITKREQSDLVIRLL